MIKINLLPHKKVKPMEKGVLKLWIITSVVLVLSIVVSAVWWSLLSFSISDMDQQRVSLRTELDKLTKDVKAVDVFEAKRKGLEQKLVIIGQLEKQRVPLTVLFNELNKYTTLDDIWFESLSFKDDSFTIKCYGKTEDSLNRYIGALKKSSVVDEVATTSLKEEPNKDRPGKVVYSTVLSGKLTGYEDVGQPLPKLLETSKPSK